MKALLTLMLMPAALLRAPVGDIALRAAEWRDYVATAYCLEGHTKSGLAVFEGIVAVDPRVIPLGSLLHLESGTYIAADTGRKIRGKKIDIYMTDCHDAKAFGHRTVPASIVKKGW